MSRIAGCLVSAVLAATAAGQLKKEEPVGLVMLAGGGKVVRARTEAAVAARTGDVLFSGDAIRAESAPVAFLYCPGKTSQSLAPGGEVLLEAAQLKVKTGKLDNQKPVAACFLPQLVRVAAATQQHYGISMTRAAGIPVPPVPPDKLPPEVIAELEPIDQVLAADPKDTSAVLARAVVFEKHKLLANALAEYRKVAAEWTDAVWVRRKIFELEDQLAAKVGAAAAGRVAGGRTLAPTRSRAVLR